MTRDEFIEGAVRGRGLEQYRTPDGFHVPGCSPAVALECRCGEPCCHGWAMVYDMGQGDIEWHRFKNAPEGESIARYDEWKAAVKVWLGTHEAEGNP